MPEILFKVNAHFVINYNFRGLKNEHKHTVILNES